MVGKKDIKALEIDGLAPTHEDYPLSQVFSFITKGNPSGAAKRFIDFALSDEGKIIMQKRGMVPIN